jgi:hypothetical protein
VRLAKDFFECSAAPRNLYDLWARVGSERLDDSDRIKAQAL